MRIPTLALRSLTLAIGMSLVASTLHARVDTAAGDVSRTAATMARTLVVFGDASHVEHAGDLLRGSRGSAVRDGATLTSDDVALLARPGTDALAVVAAADLEALGDSRSALVALMERGVPVFVCAGDGRHGPAIARTFGIAASTGDAIYLRDARGDIDILGHAGGEAHWTPAWSGRTASAVADFREKAASQQPSLSASAPRASASRTFARAPAEETSAGLPMLTVREGLLDTGSDEIEGRVTIKVVRVATRSGDDKEIHIHTWPSITPTGAGIYEGHKKKLANLTAAYLPWTYRVSHKVIAPGEKPALIDSLPVSDGRTTFDYEEERVRTINIGGSAGKEASEDGQPNTGLAAKLPFNLSFSYSNTQRELVKFSFTDYSLRATPVDSGTAMLWEAPIRPEFRHILFERQRADLPVLSEKKMTPMMRSATLDAWSVWAVPGGYEGMATVEIAAGYDRNAKEWRHMGPDLVHTDTTSPVSVTRRYTVDLSSPYLTREITVLLRSREGAGACLAAREGSVALATCDPGDRSQMWGLDSEARYANRGNGQCLDADPAVGTLRTSTCGLSNTQVWEWRADRLHSGYGDRSNRLHVVDGKPRFLAAEGVFQDTPKNPHNAILNPWTGYPKAPIAGELIPAPFGIVPGSVPMEWQIKFGGVGQEQRWDVVVVRDGLAPSRR